VLGNGIESSAMLVVKTPIDLWEVVVNNAECAEKQYYAAGTATMRVWKMQDGSQPVNCCTTLCCQWRCAEAEYCVDDYWLEAVMRTRTDAEDKCSTGSMDGQPIAEVTCVNNTECALKTILYFGTCRGVLISNLEQDSQLVYCFVAWPTRSSVDCAELRTASLFIVERMRTTLMRRQPSMHQIHGTLVTLL
jgi:hypothetical protein